MALKPGTKILEHAFSDQKKGWNLELGQLRSGVLLLLEMNHESTLGAASFGNVQPKLQEDLYGALSEEMLGPR